MKISNETKVGALTAIAITILILGFNFLKGSNLTDRNDKIYAIFPDIKGLTASNAVYINGLQVGKVADLHEKDKNLSGIIVSLTLNKDIHIPSNSMAIINSDLLGSTSLEIILGDNKQDFIRNGDTLQSTAKVGIMTEITKSLNPAIANVNKTLSSLDVLIQQLNSTLDPNTKNNLQSIIASLSASTKALEKMINAQSATLGNTLKNVETVTGALAKNSGKIDSTLGNLEKTTAHLAQANFEETLQSVSKTMNKLETTIALINSKNGSVGMLLNDRQFYDEIRMTNRSLTTLLDDFRVNPRRYVNISVFGKKTKPAPLMQPIYDSIPGK
ncbi:MAG: MlaD family protein [Flavitalea sp.]